MTYDVVIVTGDRYAASDDWDGIISLEIDRYVKENGVVLHGNARGIDTMVRHFCESLREDVYVQPYPADWNRHGRAAGPIRNEAMLDHLLTAQQRKREIGVLAFHDDLDGSKGTKHMVGIARKAGIPVHIFTTNGEVTA